MSREGSVGAGDAGRVRTAGAVSGVEGGLRRMVSGEGVGSGRGSFVMKVVAEGSVRGCCGSGVVVPGVGKGVGAVAVGSA